MQIKLQSAHVFLRAEDHSVLGVIDIVVRLPEIRVIEGIEDLHSELEFSVIGGERRLEAKHFAERPVRVVECRATHDPGTSSAPLAALRSYECRAIQP